MRERHEVTKKQQQDILAYGERLEELPTKQLLVEARSHCTKLGKDKVLVGELANRLETLIQSATLGCAA